MVELIQYEEKYPYTERQSMFGSIDEDCARKIYPLNKDTVAYADIWNYETKQMDLVQFTSIKDFSLWINNPPAAYRWTR